MAGNESSFLKHLFRDREFEKFCRDEDRYDKLPDHEKINWRSAQRTNAILGELKAIKFLLVAVILMMLAFATHTLPEGWWNPLT